MFIRCNSLLRGHSGVRIELICSILTLLNKNMTPVVPLRGSVSASGDLCPLSYIAGVLEGNPDITVRIEGTPPLYLPADEALGHANLVPITFQAKEGLGITNGTATSCATACLAIHSVSQLTLLAHLLTATGTEALLGRAENYHPFVSSVRPHPGQGESAHTILTFLKDSSLSPTSPPKESKGLAQDRYALRTAPQWLGPYLEDLALAHTQISTELNSTTDNPLINPSPTTPTTQIHHGGNFQATTLTTALEKPLLATQAMGRLIHAQSSELLNYQLTTGLPPNLAPDNPNLSFTFKGLDVNMAAYMSELSYLCHPISAHVQNAEMDNQLVNSLALLAGRYVLEAEEVLGLMLATYIYTLVQAVDLRCLHIEFVNAVQGDAKSEIGWLFGLDDASVNRVWSAVLDKWTGLAHLDVGERSKVAVRGSTGEVLRILPSSDPDSSVDTSMAALLKFQDKVSTLLKTSYSAVRARFLNAPTTPEYISPASRKLYEFVRTELGIPMHRGLVDHPTIREDGARPKKIIGSYVSEIYVAVRDGRVHGMAMQAWEEHVMP